MTSDDIMTPAAVAEFLRVPHRQVYPLIQSLPGHVKFRLGRRVRVWRHALVAWLEGQESGQGGR